MKKIKLEYFAYIFMFIIVGCQSGELDNMTIEESSFERSRSQDCSCRPSNLKMKEANGYLSIVWANNDSLNNNVEGCDAIYSISIKGDANLNVNNKCSPYISNDFRLTTYGNYDVTVTCPHGWSINSQFSYGGAGVNNPCPKLYPHTKGEYEYIHDPNGVNSKLRVRFDVVNDGNNELYHYHENYRFFAKIDDSNNSNIDDGYFSLATGECIEIPVHLDWRFSAVTFEIKTYECSEYNAYDKHTLFVKCCIRENNKGVCEVYEKNGFDLIYPF